MDSQMVPQWAKEPISNLINDLQQTYVHILVHLVGGSLFVTDKDFAINQLKWLSELNELKISDDMVAIVVRTATDKEYIQEVLHQSIVKTWSTLESSITDFLIVWLENEPKALSGEAISKIKVPLASFMSMTELERRYVLIETLKQNNNTTLKQGVTAFEALLEPFGLAGKVEDDVRKAFFELSNLRNVIVHRRGIADRRLIEACPWLDIQAGEKVNITSDMHNAIIKAVNSYVKNLMERLIAYFSN